MFFTLRRAPFYWIGLRNRNVSSERRGASDGEEELTRKKFNKEGGEGSESGELVRRIYKLARSGQTSVELWRECTSKTIEYMDRLDLKGVCSIVHSYGYMKYRDRNMLELMSAKLVENMRMISSAQITSVLRAYSILGFRSDFLFRLIIPEISLRLDMMSVAQVASIFYSYANLGYYNRNLYQSIQSFLYRNVESVSAYELTLLLNGHCRNLRAFDEKFLTVLSFQFCKLLDSYDNKLFSLSVNALSRLNFCGHKYLPSLIESEVYKRVKLARESVPSKSISLILNALSRHYESCTPLFTLLSQNVLSRIKEFDLHSICLVVSAFSRVSLSDSKTYDKIAEYIGRNSLKLYPRAISSILYSYSRVKHLHGALFYYSGKHVEINIGSYSCDELAMILRSFSLLNVKNEDVFSAVTEHILKNTPDYVPIKFEDQCAHERVYQHLENEDKMNMEKRHDSLGDVLSKESEPVGCGDRSGKRGRAEECEGFNINLLEVVTPTNCVYSNYLSNGKMHSLLWIVEAYAKFFYTSDKVTRALTRVANELVVRMNELTPFIISRLLYAFTQVHFSHAACLEMLLNELSNPRRSFKFDQKELSLIHHSLKSYALEPSSYGVYKFNRLSFQKLVETHKDKPEGVLKIVRRIVTCDLPSSKPLYMELLTNPLTQGLYGADSGVLELSEDEPECGENMEPNEMNQSVDFGGDYVQHGSSESSSSIPEAVDDHTDSIYIHIPRYVRELVKSDDSEHIDAKLVAAIDDHINYNFNLD